MTLRGLGLYCHRSHIHPTDTQSWFHSQETNIMIDSADWCTEFVNALEHNQNTALYGALDDEGEWRDKEGNLVESAGGKGGQPFSFHVVVTLN
jgi:hypothetical protein